MTKDFKEVRKLYFQKLEQYVLIVSKVHGNHHPEFHEVRKIFEAINEKSKNMGNNYPNLDEDFKNLRNITNNYEVPTDVCETYEAVYKMLEEADTAYFARDNAKIHI